MAVYEEADVVKVTEKRGVVINEFNDKLTLQVAELGQNGTWYPKWVFESKWKDGKPQPTEKKMPMGVYLGDKATALKAIAALYHALKGDAPKPKEEPVKLPPVDESDVPF